MMATDCMLTTVDNPYNPFEQFALWWLFDKDQGYNTYEYLARTVNLSDDLTEKEIDEEVERAIDEIIAFDPLNIYKKVINEKREIETETETNTETADT